MEEVGGYRLQRRIGAGGMGVVYHAIDGDGRDVALKILHPQISADPAARARLSREVDLMHRVRGKGVARVLDAEVEDEVAFVVTELIDGPTLEDLVNESGPIDGEELAALARGLAAALRSIHRVGVVHRDLKPGNVMMSSEGPVLIDFGIAQIVDDTRLTQTGMVTGTPGYLDPELVDGGDPSPVVDWWAWAAVLVFAATGRRPFGGGPALTVIARMARGDVDVEGVDSLAGAALRGALRPTSAERLDPDAVIAVLDGEWGADDLDLALGEAQEEALPGVVEPGREETIRLRTAEEPQIPGGYSTQVLPPRPAAPPPGGSTTRELPATQWQQPRTPAAEAVSTSAPPAPTVLGGPLSRPWEVPEWLRPAPARTGQVLSIGLLLVVLAGLWPGWTLVAFAALLVVAGAVGLGARQTRGQRAKRGRRSFDGPREALLFPVNLVAGAFLALLPLVVGLGLGWAAAKATAMVVEAIDALQPLQAFLPLWAGAMVAFPSAWAVPGVGPAREGARVALGTMFPLALMRAVFVLVCLALASLATFYVLSGGADAPVWGPLPQLFWP